MTINLIFKKKLNKEIKLYYIRRWVEIKKSYKKIMRLKM